MSRAVPGIGRCIALSAIVMIVAGLGATTSAAAAAKWSVIPKGPWSCSSGVNGCLAATGFRPNERWEADWRQSLNPRGNCTKYAAFRLRRNGASNFLRPGQGNAVNWKRHAKASGKRVDGKPAIGAIAWWDGRGAYGAGGFGHVAYVEKVARGVVYLSDSRWDGGSRRWTVTRASASWPDAFLHVRDKPKRRPNRLRRYAGKIVQWSGDRKSQKTAWLVGSDLRRRWIPRAAVYHCLKARGVRGPIALPGPTLDKLKDLHGVHATCKRPASPPTPAPAPPPAPAPAPAPAPRPAPKPKPKPTNRMSNDQRLLAAKNQSLRSSDGRYRLVMQSDSNLVLYGPSGRPLWASNTVGRGAHHLRMQGDGNLVIYNKANKPIWASGTPRHYKAHLIVQNDGNVVIYNASKPIWATGTDGRR